MVDNVLLFAWSKCPETLLLNDKEIRKHGEIELT
jgi:hypothetical protein